MDQPPERMSEATMRWVRSLAPRRPRQTTPEGGPDHPFAGGTVGVRAGWDGSWNLTCTDCTGNIVDHRLNDWDRQRIDELLQQVRVIVYRAQFRAGAVNEESQRA